VTCERVRAQICNNNYIEKRKLLFWAAAAQSTSRDRREESATRSQQSERFAVCRIERKRLRDRAAGRVADEARHGAALLGTLADWKGIGFVFQIRAFLPAIGILTIFLLNLREHKPQAT
jgi:hypothetical protein